MYPQAHCEREFGGDLATFESAVEFNTVARPLLSYTELSLVHHQLAGLPLWMGGQKQHPNTWDQAFLHWDRSDVESTFSHSGPRYTPTF